MEQLLEIMQSQAISSGTVYETLKSLVVAVFLSGCIYLHFRKFGSTSSSQEGFAVILPFVGLTTFLVISVVKSSLALSLGLVGALSIVRFRTPIKDPEELAYIFLAISTGIGLAANQITLTTLIVILILVLMAVFKWAHIKPNYENLYVTMDVGGISDPDKALAQAHEILSRNCQQCGIRRIELIGDVLHLAADARVSGVNSLGALSKDVRDAFGDVNVCFIDNTNAPKP